VTAEISVDCTGRVRDVELIVSDNQQLNEAARAAFSAMRFTPYIQNGTAVQVLSRMSLHFNTVRPAGVETFESARAYFDRGRRNGFLAAGSGPAYVLKAEIDAKASNGSAIVGSYVDTWLSETEWRRELSIGKNRYIRARHGEQYYEWMQGPDVQFSRFVMRAMEPIPASGTFIESDWKMRREAVGSAQTVRVLTGYESPEGVLDPLHARAYWFNDTGDLVKTYFNGLETQRFDVEDFGGISIAHLIKVFNKGEQAMQIRVTEVSPAVNVPESFFDLSGHESPHTFSDEVR
jgi:Gram-negative bacterial TonB protein C-terminal